MDSNVFSILDLDDTKAAISELQNLLLCGLCNKKALDAISLGRCDHFFCSKCLATRNDTNCPTCKIPCPPHARSKDNIVDSLLSSSEDLLKIFSGEKLSVDSQAIEAPWSTDLTKPYCSKTPVQKTKLKDMQKEEVCLKEIGNNANVKKVTKKQLCKEKSKENLARANSPMPKKLLDCDTTAGMSTPKRHSLLKQQDLTPAVNKRNAKGETSLHSFCIKGNLEKVKTLLDEGANPNTRDNAGWTPLHEASNHGYLEIAELLLRKGALVNVPGNNNETPLHDSVTSSCLHMISLLRKWGANPNLRDIWGRTPRELAANNASQEVSEALETEEIPQLVAIPKQLPVQMKITIMDSNLSSEYKKKLIQVSRLSKIRLVREYCQDVTHVVVMCDANNICQRTVKYMTGVASGKTIISNFWIDACLTSNSIVDFLEFEVIGTTICPTSKAPEKARKNTLQMYPNLFNGCHIYFQGLSGETSPCRKELETMIKSGGGVYLQREPNPESIGDVERTVPFHYTTSNGRLAKCSHFCLYKEGVNEPLMKYDMPHLKSLPLTWLFSCVEQFKIVD